MAPTNAQTETIGTVIRVRGTVQGVGFRPLVYRLAWTLGLRGIVLNDGEGVLIRVVGTPAAIATLVDHLRTDCPPLARIDAIEQYVISPLLIDQEDFQIVESHATKSGTEILPDVALCSRCRQEVLDAHSRFHRYPFTNCTHCGPRLSILRQVPYDRGNTSMAAFAMCPSCATAYEMVADRRFHAQPVACPDCGPQLWLEQADQPGQSAEIPGAIDAVDAASQLLLRGYVVAVKGLGGFHLACDATNAHAVNRLRQRKQRPHKPFALMARSLEMVQQYCDVSDVERRLLESPAAPIVLLRRLESGVRGAAIGDQQSAPEESSRTPQDRRSLAAEVAPGLNHLGMMLPYTPLHYLILAAADVPLVMTSGNRLNEPQCIDNDEARQRLGDIADYLLLHDRDIVNRVDDSVVQVVGDRPQILRRARGYAPAPIVLPIGFGDAPPLLAMGSELKTTFGFLRSGQAILSQHLGDLEDPLTYTRYRQAIDCYRSLFEIEPMAIAVDFHPEYLSSKLGKALATQKELPLHGIQHHHAHVAACLADNGISLDTEPILGIALDGLGYGADQTLWGGEFMIADYRESWRLGWLKPVAMLGGGQAILQPWRNTYAHLMSAFENDWKALRRDYDGLELIWYLESKPRSLLDQMLAQQLNSPVASSAGRLFDAVAAAVGLCRDAASYEGQGAMALEALVTPEAWAIAASQPYPFRRDTVETCLVLNPAPLWRSLLDDLKQHTAPAVIAARFHLGLATAIAQLAGTLAERFDLTQVALTGGVFQNRILSEAVASQIAAIGLTVLTHQQVPPNDGGLSLGQTVIAAARTLRPLSPAP